MQPFQSSFKKNEKQTISQGLILSVDKLNQEGKYLFLCGYILSQLSLVPHAKNSNQLFIIIQGLHDTVTSDLISNTNFIQILVQSFFVLNALKNNISNQQMINKFSTNVNNLLAELAGNRKYLREKWIKQKKLQQQTQQFLKKQQQNNKMKVQNCDEETLNLIKMLQQQEQKQLQQKKRKQKQAQIKFKQFMKIQQLKQLEKKKQRIQSQNKTLSCQICLQQISYTDVGSLNCGHIFHRSCLRSHIQALVKEKKMDIPCPLGCGKFMTIDDVHQFIDGDLKQRYDKFCFDVYVQRNDKSTSWCPTAGCTAVFSFQGGLDNYRCPVCKKHYCLNCRCEFHLRMSCAEYRISNSYSEDDKKFQQFVVGSKFKQCPKCKYWVQRTQGCSTMTCRCGHQFCYQCGGSDCPHGSCKNNPGGLVGGLFGGFIRPMRR